MRNGSFCSAALPGWLLIAAGILPAAAQGQEVSTSDRVLRAIISQFGGVGGYWFTDGSATRVLGTPKFGGDTVFYVRPAHRSHVAITGGIEVAGATDHW